MTDKEYILELELKVSLQANRIQSLEDKLSLLLDLLHKKDIKKDSHNSSMPPSSDIVPKIRSLREPSDKKTGGQLGHKGNTLFQTPTPDQIIPLKNEICISCGASLAGADFNLRVKRQVIDIPPIQTIVKEYQQFSCACLHCKAVQYPKFPKGVNAPVQYGASVQSLVSYFSVHQIVPFLRLKELFKSVFGLNFSEGSIDNILKRCSKKCEFVIDRIKSDISKSKVVGSDETGMKVNGKKGWIWVWQNVL
jgi:transposase